MDGRCPFPIALWEKAGFKVRVFDRIDTKSAREKGHVLEWDRGDGAMELRNDLFALYTLVEKPTNPAQEQEPDWPCGD